MNLQVLNDLFQLIQTTITILAVIIGGSWTYLLFIKKREKYPRLNLSHSIICKQLTKRKILLHVQIKIENKGDVLVSLYEGELWIQQILPVTPQLAFLIEKGHDPVNPGETQIEWPLIGEKEFYYKKHGLEVEPNECESIYCDFILNDYVKCIELYSNFSNISKKKEGMIWELNTIHDIIV